MASEGRRIFGQSMHWFNSPYRDYGTTQRMQTCEEEEDILGVQQQTSIQAEPARVPGEEDTEGLRE